MLDIFYKIVYNKTYDLQDFVNSVYHVPCRLETLKIKETIKFKQFIEFKY